MRSAILMVCVAVVGGCVYSDECINGAERVDGECTASGSSGSGGAAGTAGTGGAGGMAGAGGAAGTAGTGGTAGTAGAGGAAGDAGAGGAAGTAGTGGAAGTAGTGGTAGDAGTGGNAGDAGAGGTAGAAPNPIVQVALAAQHACVRRQAGEVYCRGDNTRGQLGQGNFSMPAGAVQVTLPAAAIDISGSSFHTCAALDNGEVYCWGANDNGPIGNGNTDDATSPVLVGMGQKVTGGFANSCLIRSQTAYCWGRNDNGQTGVDPSMTDSVLTVSTAPVSRSAEQRVENVVEITLGDRTNCLRDLGGRVWCLGANDARQYGAAGFPTSSFRAVDVGLTSVRSLGGTQQTWCVALTDGTVQCWGFNEQGQAGFPATITPILRRPVVGVNQVAQVGVGYSAACARQMDGSVICWGDNSTGQLGQSNTLPYTTPIVVPGVTASSISVGLGGNTCAIVDGGDRVLCWGGSFTGDVVSTPTELSFD